jgi:hypothetical protein
MDQNDPVTMTRAQATLLVELALVGVTARRRWQGSEVLEGWHQRGCPPGDYLRGARNPVLYLVEDQEREVDHIAWDLGLGEYGVQ